MNLVRRTTAKLKLFCALAAIAISVSASIARAADEKPPELVGTHWQLLSLTGKGEKIEDAKNPADVEFLKDNKWGILHYGGRREAGSFQIKADRLIMKDESGETYQDAKMTWKPETKILELNDGQYLMRLRLYKPDEKAK